LGDAADHLVANGDRAVWRDPPVGDIDDIDSRNGQRARLRRDHGIGDQYRCRDK
jgi:hypothetical protein